MTKLPVKLRRCVVCKRLIPPSRWKCSYHVECPYGGDEEKTPVAPRKEEPK